MSMICGVDCITDTETWADGTLATATFDVRREYRYLLTRRFPAGDHSRVVAFVMLNPSTANALKNDPTITRCCNYAARWGYGGIAVVNIFALMATNPRELKRVLDPTGGVANEDFIIQTTRFAALTVCAWGAMRFPKSSHSTMQAGHVRWLLRTHNVKVSALGVTKSGEPCHPLYLPGDLIPFRYER